MRTIFLSILLICSFVFNSNGRDSLFLQGLDGMLEENYEKAQSDFQNDILKSPSFSSYYNLGVASGSLEDWSKAKWAFESALKYKPLNSDAQFNAEFATRKISENHAWEHPYPWIDRVVLGFGINVWLVFVVLSSTFLGTLVFFIISKTKTKSTIKKWCLRLVAPAIVLFLISFYGIYLTNNHYSQQRFAIVKSNKTKFYISPNGVELREEIDPASRLKIKKFFKNNTWVQVKSQDGNLFWIKSADLYTY